VADIFCEVSGRLAMTGCRAAEDEIEPLYDCHTYQFAVGTDADPSEIFSLARVSALDKSVKEKVWRATF
jgi:hypothetical protein